MPAVSGSTSPQVFTLTVPSSASTAVTAGSVYVVPPLCVTVVIPPSEITGATVSATRTIRVVVDVFPVVSVALKVSR